MHLKYRVEAYDKATGHKIVMALHSMAFLLIHYFFARVTTPEEERGQWLVVVVLHRYTITFTRILLLLVCIWEYPKLLL